MSPDKLEAVQDDQETLERAIANFVDRVVEHPRSAPKWFKRLLAERVRDILNREARRRRLIDAAEPYTEILRLKRAA